MKRIFSMIFAVVVAAMLPAAAQSLADGQIEVRGARLEKTGMSVNADMDIVLDDLDLQANKGLVLTPEIVSGKDTLALPSVEILGRLRYLYWQRNGVTATENPLIVVRRFSGDPQSVHYSFTTDYQDWMKSSHLSIRQEDCGCAQSIVGSGLAVQSGALKDDEPEAEPEEPAQWKLAFVQPKAEVVKERAVSGSARLNFIIDRYDIRPDFGNNAFELKKIRQTIDVVRNDKDVTLTGISLHGYASPDGSYAHNAELAANRTAALKAYLENYYKVLDDRLFTIASTPEDWEGVREYVDTSDINIRGALLDIIDDKQMTPDEKDRTIASRYTTFYRNTLLTEVYPFLRRTDYKVSYTVRNFSLEEARRMILEKPQNLSLNEMYEVASSWPKGSPEFREVFDIAVRMFPESEPANVNAAAAALENVDTASASKFLARAGDSPEALNARGVLAAMNGDYDAAAALFSQAGTLPEARSNFIELGKKRR